MPTDVQLKYQQRNGRQRSKMTGRVSAMATEWRMFEKRNFAIFKIQNLNFGPAFCLIFFFNWNHYLLPLEVNLSLIKLYYTAEIDYYEANLDHFGESIFGIF